MNNVMDKSEGILGRWYAEPMDREAALQLYAAAEARLHRYLRTGRHCLTCRFGLVIARFWLDKDFENELESLRHVSRGSGHARVLCELLHGQLLMSRQLEGAMAHLERAFMLGRDLFSPADYFRIMKRHQLLDLIPLSKQPATPRTLHELLTSAAVMREFDKRQQRRKPFIFDPKDTYG